MSYKKPEHLFVRESRSRPPITACRQVIPNQDRRLALCLQSRRGFGEHSTNVQISSSEKARYLSQTPSLSTILMPVMPALTFSYPEYLSPTYRTHTLSCRPAILHGYGPGISNLSFGAAFDTIGLHQVTLLFGCTINHSSFKCQ